MSDPMLPLNVREMSNMSNEANADTISAADSPGPACHPASSSISAEVDKVFNADEEPFSVRIERLGRQRPPQFKNLGSEIGFLFSICMSQIMAEYFVSGFTVILPTLVEKLHIPTAATVWPASAFSLVIASTLLVFGRLGDMFGGFYIYVLGFSWLVMWSVIAGFSINPFMLNFCRGLAGLGPAAFLPSGVMILGAIYRPGPRKNLVFGMYGGCAVVGFFVGVFFAGLTDQLMGWSWYFWIGAILSTITCVTSCLTIPNDFAEKRRNRIAMDYCGSLLIVSGLVLLVFSITESSYAPHGWRTPYIPVTLIVRCLLLFAAVYVEGWVAKQPLLPFDLFQVPSMGPLVVALIFSYGTLGVWILFATLYFENCMGTTSLQVVAWYAPMVLGGLFLSTAGGFVLHLLPGTGLLIFSGLGWIGANLVLALVPSGGTYWAYVLPSMILGNIGIDITFTIVNIFVTTSMPSERQGLAGAVLNSILHVGIALLLGFGNMIQTARDGQGLCESSHDVFWYGVACAGVALIIMLLFVKVDKAKSDLTADEKRTIAEDAKQSELAAVGHPSRLSTIHDAR